LDRGNFANQEIMAMANHRRDERKERLWRRVLGRRVRSGLSVRAFCLRHGIKESAYYFWRREMKRRDALGLMREPRRVCEGDGTSARKPPARDDVLQGIGFIPRGEAVRRRRHARFVPIAVPPSGPSPRGIDVVRPDGITLRVPAGCQAELLRMVWETLESVRIRPREATPC
jgi:hypothetical protein